MALMFCVLRFRVMNHFSDSCTSVCSDSIELYLVSQHLSSKILIWGHVNVLICC